MEIYVFDEEHRNNCKVAKFAFFSLALICVVPFGVAIFSNEHTNRLYGLFLGCLFSILFLIMSVYSMFYMLPQFRKIVFKSNAIQVCSHKGKLVYEVSKDRITKISIKPGVTAFRPITIEDFIVLYVGTGHEEELDNEFEYRSYRDDRNFILIKNRDDIYQKILKEFCIVNE